MSKPKCPERLTNKFVGIDRRCTRSEGHDGLHWAKTADGRRFAWWVPEDPEGDPVWGWR